MRPRKMRRPMCPRAASFSILIALTLTSCSMGEAGGFHNHHHNQHSPFQVNHQKPNSNDHIRHPALASLFQHDQQMDLATNSGRTGGLMSVLGVNTSSVISSTSLSPIASTSTPTSTMASLLTSSSSTSTTTGTLNEQHEQQISCSNGLLTFELSTGFIYKPSSAETLAMMPSTLQLTDCLEFCLQNSSCLAVNFEMGLCVLLSSSAKQNPTSLFSSQFPVFTIYAEKKCLLQGEASGAKQRARCRRAWTFERAAGFEMKSRPRRRLRLASREQCMEACLGTSDFECRSANWYRLTGECTLSDQDRHSVSQSEAGDQQLNADHLQTLYGPASSSISSDPTAPRPQPPRATPPPGLYQNYYWPSLQERMRAGTGSTSISNGNADTDTTMAAGVNGTEKVARSRLSKPDQALDLNLTGGLAAAATAEQQSFIPANAVVDYLENNCVIEPNKLCEFRKIQNRVLKTVDSIYQDVSSLEECKQRCLSAPYRCYSFDYGDTAERVCRTSHLDQASLLAVQDPYLEVAGAITYELASCFSVSIQCKAREMVAQVSSSKSFKGRIYAKSRPSTCVNDVRDSLKFELAMRYHDPDCDVRASSTSQQGVFSNDIVIQHHDRIVTTQDVGLSVYCQYDLGNRSITNNVDLAIDRIDDSAIESKNQPLGGLGQSSQQGGSPLTITSLATTVVRSPNVTMRITNMNGQPVASATVGDRLALLFEIKEKTSPFGIFVREIIAIDGKQLLAGQSNNNRNNNNGAKRGYHYSANGTGSGLGGGGDQQPLDESAVESLFQATQNGANSVQFIDSDGCPTDANLMGPLVKMDPQGHRVLAPFDAFKFPTSDMVFFRAVVTSCVSECRPAVCPSATGVSGPPASLPMSPPADLAHFYSTTNVVLSTTTESAVTPTTAEPAVTPPRHQLLRNSSPAPASAMTTVRSQLESETTLGNNPLLSAVVNRNKSRPATGGDSSNWQLNDALTTTANLGQIVPVGTNPAGTTTDAWPLAKTTTTTTTTTSSSSSSSSANVTGNTLVAQNDHQPINSLLELNSTPATTMLSSGQRQQVIKLLEQRLQQQLSAGQAPNNNGSNMNMGEMAHLYANFLANLMLGAPNPALAPKLPLAPSPLPDVGYRRQQEPMAPLVSEQQQESVTARSTDIGGELASDVSLVHQFKSLKLNRSELAELVKSVALTALTLDASSRPETTSKQPDAEANKAQIDRLADSKVDIDVALNVAGAADGFDAPNARLTMSSQEVSSNPKSTTTTQQPPLVTANRQRSNSNNRPTNKKPDLNLAERRKASLQALADSYLGAYQSYGRRRRRRSIGEDALDELEPGYLLLHQRPLNGLEEVAPSALSHHKSLARPRRQARFTGALVEMYHHNRKQKNHLVAKREAQPFYDMDELVVQSIKIVDRLQFKDEETQADLSNGSRPMARTSSGASTTGSGSPEAELGGGGGKVRIVSWTSPGLLGAIILASIFVFLQIFLVLICLIDWHQRRRLLVRRQQHQQRVLSNSLSKSALLMERASSLSSPTISTTSSSSMISQGWRTLGRRDHQLQANRPPTFLHHQQHHFQHSHKCAGCQACRQPAAQPSHHHHHLR